MTTQYPKLFEALLAPFTEGEVKVRAVDGGQHLQYITARSVMNRLDSVLGPENWWDSYQPVGNAILCSLTIRLPNGECLTKQDVGRFAGMEPEEDNEKSNCSDSFKRAAVKYGIARYLYRDGVPFSAGAEKEPPVSHTTPDHESSRHSENYNAPTTGRQLFAWAKKFEERTGANILSDLNRLAKKNGVTGRTVDWTPAEVARIWPIALSLTSEPTQS